MFIQGCFVLKTRFLRGGWERHFRESFSKTIQTEVHLSASLLIHFARDMSILLHDSLNSCLRFNSFALILMPYDDRTLESSKHVAHFILHGVWESRPFRLDGSFGNLAYMGFQIGISFIARIAIPFVGGGGGGGAGMGVFVAIIILVIPVTGALSLGRHCKLDMKRMTEKEKISRRNWRDDVVVGCRVLLER